MEGRTFRRCKFNVLSTMSRNKLKVNFTYALSRFYPDLGPMEIEAETIEQVLDHINQTFSGFSDYIVDERGQLRKHVNIFLDDQMILDRKTLSDPLEDVAEIYIMQALSGG